MRRAAMGACLACVACQDLSGFSTGGGSYEGAVVPGGFVRSGVTESVRACLTLDANHFQDAPGAISTDDGLFHTVSLRPIPQIWYDPLSTFTFGEGRLKNLLYVATTSTPFDDGNRATYSSWCHSCIQDKSKCACCVGRRASRRTARQPRRTCLRSLRCLGKKARARTRHRVFLRRDGRGRRR